MSANEKSAGDGVRPQPAADGFLLSIEPADRHPADENAWMLTEHVPSESDAKIAKPWLARIRSEMKTKGED